jgi:hypothetical protein
MQVNVLEVVRRSCTDDRMIIPHSTVYAKHKLSTVEIQVGRMKHKLKDSPSNLSIVNLLFLHGSCVSMSLKVIFRRNGKKGNKDASKIGRL